MVQTNRGPILAGLHLYSRLANIGPILGQQLSVHWVGFERIKKGFRNGNNFPDFAKIEQHKTTETLKSQ